MKFYFKTGLRYRKEQNYILLCDCINLIDFQVPLEFWSLLQKLSKGCDVNKIKNKRHKELINDFQTFELITSNKKEIIASKVKDLCLSYDEREFL